MEMTRVSVRELVAFTFHGEDILPGGSMQDMMDGTSGHIARQQELGDDWHVEVPLQLEIQSSDQDSHDGTLQLTGRMDGFRPGGLPKDWREHMAAQIRVNIQGDQSLQGVECVPSSFNEGTEDVPTDVPLIEEIKLWKGKHPPEAPAAAHWMQGVVYGAMLSLGIRCSRVGIRVVYVSKSGRQIRSFPHLYEGEELASLLIGLLQPYVQRQRLLSRHRGQRDEGLRRLQFPFGAYRAGQREMAVQVYTAIQMKKRLFASMPTGTGKSMAVLFPALKAMGKNETGQICYLSARTTGQKSPEDALNLIRSSSYPLWSLVLKAKEKQCPEGHICHPDFCSRAKGHYLRDQAAIEAVLTGEEEAWTPERIRLWADAYHLCPFEFSLSLAEAADVIVCDYNYVLDPVVHIRRIFDQRKDVTLLVDEAHHLQSRVRDMLSGSLDLGLMKRFRTAAGKVVGRDHRLYRRLTDVLNVWENVPLPPEEKEGVLPAVPDNLLEALADLVFALMEVREARYAWGENGAALQQVIFAALSMVRALRREEVPRAFLWQGRKNSTVTCFALDGAEYLKGVTRGLSGVVCFSATLAPLGQMRFLLGGEEEDGCFAMPSPFPRENLLVLRQRVNTRYAHRDGSSRQVADAIRALVSARPGKYMVFFPSFAYLHRISEELTDLPHQVQSPSMTEEDRSAFLCPYREEGPPVLSLCVMGGVFSEGIDLPGRALDGVAVVGVGLPQVGLFQETLRAYYDEKSGQGFLFAYQIPGMQKVAQAVGRVIRTGEDRGVALLLDERFGQAGYLRLCPEHWRVEDGDIKNRLNSFWRDGR